MSLTEAAAGFLLLLLLLLFFSAAEVQIYTRSLTCNPTSICAARGSAVEITCRIPPAAKDRDIVQVSWYRTTSEGRPLDLTSDLHYRGRLTYTWEKSSCSLRIMNLNTSDSATYHFLLAIIYKNQRHTYGAGVTLSVTDVEVEFDPLKCKSRCEPHKPYILYENGKERSTTWARGTNSFSCAMDGYPSPAKCVSGQSCNRVIYTDRSVCALRGSSVDISCSYHIYSYYNNPSVRSKFWFRPKSSGYLVDISKDYKYSDRVQVLETEGGGSTLRIRDLRETDSAQYRFTFRTSSMDWGTNLPGTTLTVTDIKVKVFLTTYTHLIIKCDTTCPLLSGSSYIWYKNGQKISGEGSSSYYYSLDSWDYQNSYSCTVEGFEDSHSNPFCPSFPHCNSLNYTERRVCAIKGSSIDISCDYKSYEVPQSQFWFLADQAEDPSGPEDLLQNQQFSHRVQVFQRTPRRSTLTIRDLRETDSAQYRFTFRTPSVQWGTSLPGTTLTVTAVQVLVTRVKPRDLFYTEAKVSCHISCRPAGYFSFVWFKNGEKISAAASSFTLYFYPGDRISCAFRGYELHPSPPVYGPQEAVVLSPSGPIVEGSSVNLTCSSDANPAPEYTWYKENQPLSHKEPQLIFSSIQSSDSGRYHCAAENQLWRTESENIYIDVEYPPKLPSVSVSPSGQIVEGSSVTLSCSSDSNPAPEYTWYKENQPLSHKEPQLIFSSIQSSDSGRYHCAAENQLRRTESENISIDVEYPPKLLSVSVSPSGQMVEGSSVTLNCSSDSNPAAHYTWYKEDEDSPRASGQIFTITDLRPEHSGNYSCEAQNTRGRQRSTLNLTVSRSSARSAAAGSITVILLAVIILSAFVLIRRHGSLRQPSEERRDSKADQNTAPDYENTSAAVQIKSGELTGDLLYTSVRFTRSQEDPLYSNVRQAQPSTHMEDEEEEEEDVEYSCVQGLSASPRLTCPEDEEDPSALYSRVSRKSRV